MEYFTCLFVEWVGTEAIFTALPHHDQSVAEPLCLHSYHYYLNPLAALPALKGTSGHRALQFLKEHELFPFPPDRWRHRERTQHHLAFLFWGVLC